MTGTDGVPERCKTTDCHRKPSLRCVWPDNSTDDMGYEVSFRCTACVNAMQEAFVCTPNEFHVDRLADINREAATGTNQNSEEQ